MGVGGKEGWCRGSRGVGRYLCSPGTTKQRPAYERKSRIKLDTKGRNQTLTTE